jgi:hypothetical protein
MLFTPPSVPSGSRDARKLHMFVFDERYTTLLGLGSMIDLSPWYEGLSTISHITFAGGAGEELLLVDEHQNARIFSLITQQFRFVFFRVLSKPPTNQLAALPLSLFPKPPYASSLRPMVPVSFRSPIRKVTRSFVPTTGRISVPPMALS